MNLDPKAALKPHALQTLARILKHLRPREASGLRRVYRRFSTVALAGTCQQWT